MINSNWRATRISALIALVFLIGIFVPSALGMDGFAGGYALAVLSGFVMMMGIVSAFVFASLARQQDKILQGQDLLAHWVYTRAQWGQFFREEAVRDREGKKWLFYIVTFWAVLFGIAFPIYDHENGIFVTYIMLALIVLIGCVAWLSIRITRHNLENHGGEAWISTTGAYIAGQMYSWALGSKNSLTQVTYFEDETQPLIQIDFMGGNTEYSVRIPVPSGKDEEARKIAQTLGTQSHS